jgi:protein NirF
MRVRELLTLFSVCLLTACSATPKGTGDLGIVIERDIGSVQIVQTTDREQIATISGLGDLSHASVVFSRDGRFAYVFGRDGGLTKIDLLTDKISNRIIQAGNSIGGAISQDGRYVAAQNYTPGGVKIFDAKTLQLVSDIPATGDNGENSKVVGLADAPGHKFVFSLFEAGEIWTVDIADISNPKINKYPAGKQPYDGLITPDGRYYLAGLFGEDGLALLDLWNPEKGSRRILKDYGRGEKKMPVYKMPHLRGWAVAAGQAYLPAIGRHELLIVDTKNWQESGRVKLAGQPVFAIARPDAHQIWVTFAFPDNGTVQVVDTASNRVVKTLSPGKAILHLEFTPRGENVWLSSRDDNKVVIYDTNTYGVLKTLPASAPSGIFFTNRSGKIGF